MLTEKIRMKQCIHSSCRMCCRKDASNQQPLMRSGYLLNVINSYYPTSVVKIWVNIYYQK